ncbi:sulfite exporter TauE/SafE family protein [Chitinilyticum litopenaei]|uniref:sulfite exporter TauE/SafE family protein n=1 Tax=Chitinilyticum litopenaei TaxID=1121276 RepID=UPI000412C9AB|nr:sulfite exporter TauE/SafE family protein [Chitinilyticum litopenaei]
MLTLILACLAVGGVAGVLAGLLGVGGGLVIVPALLLVLPLAGVPASHIQHVALGTSLATIMFTGAASMLAHHRRGSVRWSVVRGIAPGIVVGTFAGAQLAGRMSGALLQWIFVLFAYLVAWQMLAQRQTGPARSLPGTAGLGAAGGVIGVASSWVGIGGGSLSVPFLSWCGVPLREAIGSSAAIGVVIALAGSVGYVISGMGIAGLPNYSMGFIYIPAFVLIVLASMPLTRVGAALAHRLPVVTLKKLFAGLLIVLASKMLYGLL